MAKVIRREKRQRGFFGWIFLILFILFNLGMAAWLFTYWGVIAHVDLHGSQAAEAGRDIGATFASGVVLFFWVAGDVILGLFVLLTRGSLVTVEESFGPGEVDTTKWNKRDRAAYAAQRNEPRF